MILYNKFQVLYLYNGVLSYNKFNFVVLLLRFSCIESFKIFNDKFDMYKYLCLKFLMINLIYISIYVICK